MYMYFATAVLNDEVEDPAPIHVFLNSQSRVEFLQCRKVRVLMLSG